MQSPFLNSTCGNERDLAVHNLSAKQAEVCDLAATNINGVAAIQYTTTTFTAAQVNGMHTGLAVSLVPAPGPGRFVVPVLIEVYLPAGSLAFNTQNSDKLWFHYGITLPSSGNLSMHLVQLNVHGTLNSTNKGSLRVLGFNAGAGSLNTGGLVGNTTTSPVNQPVAVSLTPNQITGGRDGLQIRVYYHVVSALGAV